MQQAPAKPEMQSKTLSQKNNNKLINQTYLPWQGKGPTKFFHLMTAPQEHGMWNNPSVHYEDMLLSWLTNSWLSDG